MGLSQRSCAFLKNKCIDLVTYLLSGSASSLNLGTDGKPQALSQEHSGVGTSPIEEPAYPLGTCEDFTCTQIVVMTAGSPESEAVASRFSHGDG